LTTYDQFSHRFPSRNLISGLSAKPQCGESLHAFCMNGHFRYRTVLTLTFKSYQLMLGMLILRDSDGNTFIVDPNP
jgi:hypothetical protein